MNTILLDSSLDIVLVEGLRTRFVEAIEKTGNLTLDASLVERITTPCIQLLIAADQELSKNGEGLKLIQATDVVVSALKDIGLEDTYQRWSN